MCWLLFSGGQAGEDGFLDVEAVFCLVEDGFGVGLKDLSGDFLSAVGGEAVHDQCVRFGGLRDARVDLVWGEDAEAFFAFLLLAHRNPCVRVEKIGTLRGVTRIFEADGSALFCACEHAGGGLKRFGRGEADVESQFGCGKNPGLRDVAGGIAEEDCGFAREQVTDPSRCFLLAAEKVFGPRHEIGENLAGMFVVGEGVDDGNGADSGERFHLALRVGADDDAMEIAGEDARGVLDAFPASELDVMHAEEERASAQFADADFKGDTGARGAFAEDERPAFSLERSGMLSFSAQCLEAKPELEEILDLGGRKGFDGKEMVQEN